MIITVEHSVGCSDIITQLPDEITMCGNSDWVGQIQSHSPDSGQLSAPALAIPFGIVLFSPITSPSVSLEHSMKQGCSHIYY